MGNFTTSTVYLKIITRSPDLSSWLWWVKDELKHTQPGLVKRRRDELVLFLYAIYGSLA